MKMIESTEKDIKKCQSNIDTMEKHSIELLEKEESIKSIYR